MFGGHSILTRALGHRCRIAALAACTILAGTPALADHAPSHEHPHPHAMSRHAGTPGEAARRAQHLNGGGRVLSVSRGKDGYRVKLIKKGEIRIISVPGN